MSSSKDDAPVTAETHDRRTRDIPGLPAHLQPTPEIKAAYWFAATLTDDYGWKLFEVGSDTAAGGFIADIPGGTMVIYPASASYPASMAGDCTAASALARLLGSMSAQDAQIFAALVQWKTQVLLNRSGAVRNNPMN